MKFIYISFNYFIRLNSYCNRAFYAKLLKEGKDIYNYIFLEVCTINYDMSFIIL